MARSWLNPALIEIRSLGVTSRRYNPLEQAYVLDCADGTAHLAFRVEASRGAPLVNLALVVRNWAGPEVPPVRIDGRVVERGPSYRLALREALESQDLLAWLPLNSESPVEIIVGTSPDEHAAGNVDEAQTEVPASLACNRGQGTVEPLGYTRPSDRPK
jgi:hypothetical protein